MQGISHQNERVRGDVQDFTMRWSIHHITSSPHFPHGNAHAEKAVHVVKQIYMKADDVKLALLLLKMMPITNQRNIIQDAPAKLFYGCQLKAHLPVKRKPAVIQNFDEDVTSEVPIPSKYSVGDEVWVKLDANTKWMPGKIKQVLPNQSYSIRMMDGHIFRRNEHHVTTRRQGGKWPDVSNSATINVPTTTTMLLQS